MISPFPLCGKSILQVFSLNRRFCAAVSVGAAGNLFKPGPHCSTALIGSAERRCCCECGGFWFHIMTPSEVRERRTEGRAASNHSARRAGAVQSERLCVVQLLTSGSDYSVLVVWRVRVLLAADSLLLPAKQPESYRFLVYSVRSSVRLLVSPSVCSWTRVCC